MGPPATHYTNHFQIASAAFAEGFAVLALAAGVSLDEGRPAIAYGQQAITTGLLQLEALAKGYSATPEYAQRAPARPIMSDPLFRAAGLECAEQLEKGATHLSVAGKRIAATLRTFIEGNDPTQARTLAAQCDAAARMAKARSGRAA